MKIDRWRGIIPDDELATYGKGAFGNPVGLGRRPALLNRRQTWLRARGRSTASGQSRFGDGHGGPVLPHRLAYQWEVNGRSRENGRRPCAGHSTGG